jgi:enterochelin esterase-like enzyme
MIRDLIEQALARRTPMIDGDQATFVWQGKRAARLVGDFNDWDEDSAIRLTRVAPHLWKTTLSFPRDAYFEYVFLVGGQNQLDPYNKRRVSNGLGKYNNYFYMPEGQPSPLVRRARGVRHGLVTRHWVETEDYAAGYRRLVYLYRPVSSKPTPLLVVWDGLDYFHRAHLVNIVDSMIAQQIIQPLALAMVQNGKQVRNIEYACSEATLAFLMLKVLPVAYDKLNLQDPLVSPGTFGVLGASMGGVMALFTGLRIPEVFGRVLCQSGAFNHFGHRSVVSDLIQQSDLLPIRIWMDAGRFENLVGPNRMMKELLLSKGYPVIYQEYNGGHAYTAWGNDLSHGLEALFGVNR